METTFTAASLVKDAYAIIKPQFWKVVGKYAVLCFFFLFLSVAAGNNLLLSLIVSVVSGIAGIQFSLAYSRGGVFHFTEMFNGVSFRTVAYYALGMLLVGFAVAAGFLLLIVPGVIFALKYSQTRFLIIDKHMKPMEAVRESARLTKGKRGKIFGFALLLLLVNILGALALLVGLLFTIPLSLIATAVLYKSLTTDPVQESHEPAGESVIVDTDAFSSADLA